MRPRASFRVIRLRRQKAANGNILVDVWPVDADTTTDEAPVRTLLGRGAKEAWKPLQRGRNAPSVNERNNEFVVGAGDIGGVGSGFTG